MAEKYLIVVDVQNDFVTGSLGAKEAVQIIPEVLRKVKNFEGIVYFTQDTHEVDYLQTQEGKHLPVKHCINGTEGWQLVDGLKQLQQEKRLHIYQKNTFGCVKLAEELRENHQKKEVESIELIGLCTDICVVSNALLLKANMPEVPIFVDAACCAGVTPESHLAALKTMESCQILVKNKEYK